MLTLVHSPNSRSTAIISLIDEMGIQGKLDVQLVQIRRRDGSGARDPANPHPEGKVPALIHDGQIITERAAIMLHLTTLFPETGLAPPIGTPEWGRFVSWLTWYQGVLEPVLIFHAMDIVHPALTATFRGHSEALARIKAALNGGPWLMGEHFTAADILVHSPYAWFPDITPEDPVIQDWIERCMARPSRIRTIAAETSA